MSTCVILTSGPKTHLVERVVSKVPLSYSSHLLQEELSSLSGKKEDSSPTSTLPRLHLGDEYTEPQVDAFLSWIAIGSSSVMSPKEQVSLRDSGMEKSMLLALPLLRKYKCNGILSLLKQVVTLRASSHSSWTEGSCPKDVLSSFFPLLDSLLRSDDASEREWADPLLSFHMEGVCSDPKKATVAPLSLLVQRVEGMDSDLVARLLHHSYPYYVQGRRFPVCVKEEEGKPRGQIKQETTPNSLHPRVDLTTTEGDD